MTGKSTGGKPATINKGPAPEQRRQDDERRFDIAGNAETRGEDPSPDDRERGEVSSADKQSAIPLKR